jgi:hypothetical protein
MNNERRPHENSHQTRCEDHSFEHLHSKENAHCVLGSGKGQDRFRLGNGHHRKGGRGIAVVLPDVFCPQTKPNRKVRSVMDLVQLNKFVDRPTHPFPAPKDIIASRPKGSKCFAVF